MDKARQILPVSIAAFALSCGAALPTVTETSFVQNADTHKASVSFTLGAKSVVTLDIQTNGVSIGWRNFRGGVTGCDFGKANPAGDYLLEWEPWTTWSDAPKSIPAGSLKAVVTAWSLDNTPDFMDIDLASKSNVTYYVSEEDLPYPVTSEIFKTSHLLLKRIHAANKRWAMGSPESEKGRAAAAKLWENQRDVVLSQDYYIGVFETTQGQWKRMTGNELPASVVHANDSYPMSNRRYNSLRGWYGDHLWPIGNHWVSDSSDLGKARMHTSIKLDLPTEAQWEYACRGGTATAYNTGSNGGSNGLLPDSELSAIARWIGNSVSQDGAVTNYTTVGSFAPNGFGLYDTVGNVSELCLDFRTKDGSTFDPCSDDLVDPAGGRASASAGASGVSARGSNYLSKNVRYVWDNIYNAEIFEHRSAYRGIPYIHAATENRTEVGFRLAAPVGEWAPLNSEVGYSPAQSEGSRTVKFKYDLEEDAIVTLKVLVDGAVVDGAASCAGGDVNRFVEAGEGKMISWYPDRSLEGLDIGSGRVELKLEKWSKDNPPAYMALDLTSPAKTNIAYYSEFELPGGATNEMFKTDWLLMRRIPAKDVVWWMGVATNAAGASVEGSSSSVAITERRHLVKLTSDYFIGVFPVTQRQLQYLDGASADAENWTKPARLSHQGVRRHQDGKWPEDGYKVSSDQLLGILRTRSGGYRFDLPTEAQWEFACRALTGSAFCDGNAINAANNGNTPANVSDYGWVGGGDGAPAMPVGQKKHNAFGLYDMHGNSWEWCLDYYDIQYGLSDSELAAAQTVPVEDPVGAKDKAWNANIMLKGGAASKDHSLARSGYHFGRGYCDNIYYNGGSTVRVACPIVQKEDE